MHDGSAKNLVQDSCTLEFEQIGRGLGHTVNMMMAAGAPITREQGNQIRDYLIARFPEKPRPKLVAISGPVQVKFREWSLPTPGERPHDPLAMPDGSLGW